MQRIARIRIDNILGTTRADFAPGTVTILRGANGTGKSSILKALANVFEGGHDPSLVRKGAAAGEIRLELSDGTIIVKTITPQRSVLEVTDPAGRVIPAPATYVRELGRSMSVDPAQVLTIDASTAPGRKALIEAFLAALDISFDADEVRQILKDIGGGLLQRGPVDLAEMDKLLMSLKETRRRIGVERRELEAHVKKLRESVARAEPSPDADSLEAAEQARRDLEQELVTAETKIIEESQAIIRASEEEVRQAQRRHNELVAKVDSERVEKLRRLRIEMAPKLQAAGARIQRLRQNAEEAARYRGAIEQIEKLDQAVREKYADYGRYEAVLRKLEKLRETKVAECGIPGVSFSGDSILVDGVEWQNVNQARRTAVALQLCARRSGRLPFLILDDAEHLDSSSWAELVTACAQEGYQLIAAKVTGDENLTIEAL